MPEAIAVAPPPSINSHKLPEKPSEAVQDGYQITEKDAAQLAMTDEEFKLQTWEDLLAIVRENRLEDLKRIPSELKRYIAWSYRTRNQYGSIQAFVLSQRLGWSDLDPINLTPYADSRDTKILINDWPYGNEPGILHLVCWTKSPIPTEPVKGDLTEEARANIEGWVTKTFKEKLGEDNVIWFKNWASIQSVRSVEHIHVLVRNYDMGFVEEVVGKDAVARKSIGEIEKEKAEAKQA